MKKKLVLKMEVYGESVLRESDSVEQIKDTMIRDLLDMCRDEESISRYVDFKIEEDNG